MGNAAAAVKERPPVSGNTDEVMALRAEILALKNKLANGKTLGLKVSNKGAVSVYGLQRFPVTLYQEQWEKLAKAIPDILEFCQANAGKLKTKA